MKDKLTQNDINHILIQRIAELEKVVAELERRTRKRKGL